MIKNILAIGGLLLFLIGLFLFFRVRQASSAAVGFDNQWQTGGEDVGVCSDLLRQANVADRVMSERESQALNILLVNDNSPAPCNTTITLAAPNFDMSPPESNRPVTVPPGEEVTLNWIISPRRTGTYVISISTPTQAITLGITVTTVLGLTAVQAELLSILSTLLGPMLTVPWWYEQWQKRKKEKAAIPPKPVPPVTEPVEPHYTPE